MHEFDSNHDELLRVLIIDDSDDDAALVDLHLSRRYRIQSVRVDTREALRSVLSDRPWDIALCDGNMPHLDVMGALAVIRDADPELPIIVVSGALDEPSAVVLMDAGIRDFINKNELSRLNPAIRRELRDAKVRRRQATLLSDLEQSNKELHRFAFIASHDLKEPLRRIQSCAQMIEEELASMVDQEALFHLRVMTDSAGHLTEMVDDLLDYSNLNSEIDGDREGIQAHVLARRAWDSLQEVCVGADATVQIDDMPMVECVPSQLQCVFRNLIENALKFRRDEAPSLRLTSAWQGPFWQCAVSDNGIGVDPAHADRIFDVFQRLHTGERYEGTGIGLSICRRIIERHGGKIWLDPDYQGGACLRFTLPAPSALTLRNGIGGNC